MNELNFTSYVKIMAPNFNQHDSQESAVRFLLDSINNQDYIAQNDQIVDINSKKTSNITNKKSPIPSSIKKASVLPEVIENVDKYFIEEVIKDLNPHNKETMLNELVQLIKIDSYISEKKRNSLLELYNSGDDAVFLSRLFLYVINLPRKKSSAIKSIVYKSSILESTDKDNILPFLRNQYGSIKDLNRTKKPIELCEDIVYKLKGEFNLDARFNKHFTRFAHIQFVFQEKEFNGDTSVKNWRSESELNNIISTGTYNLTAYFNVLNTEKGIVNFLVIGE